MTINERLAKVWERIFVAGNRLLGDTLSYKESQLMWREYQRMEKTRNKIIDALKSSGDDDTYLEFLLYCKASKTYYKKFYTWAYKYGSLKF